MNLQRREEIRAMCAEPARGGTQGAKQIFDLRDAINELFAHIDALEQTAAERVIADGRARAVVVPDITDDDFESISILMQENGIGCHSEDDESFRRIVASTWAYTQGFRAIPADRVLGEGMVAVDRALIRRLSDWFAWCGIGSSAVASFRKDLDALRANQGGAAT